MNNGKTMTSEAAGLPGLSGLEALETSQPELEDGGYPVEKWHPEYCGELDLRIGADGTWFYQGSPIGRKRLIKLFAKVLRKDDDGRHYLVTPVEKLGIEVEDAPLLAVELDVAGEGDDQDLIFRTNMDDRVKADADHPLRFGEDAKTGAPKPYLRVRGRLDALCVRAVYYDLVERGVSHEIDGASWFGIWSGGEFFAMARAQDLDR